MVWSRCDSETMASGSGRPSRDLRVVARPDASSLHRSAVMLTGAVSTADELVLATLRRVGRGSHGVGAGGSAATGGSEPDLLAELVRQYLRRSSRRRIDGVETVGVALDASEVLDSLRPRQRAAAVLVLVHGWSAERTARAVGVSMQRLPSLVPGTVGLADALQAVAYHHDAPVEDLFTAVLAEPPGGQEEANRGSQGPATNGHPPGSTTVPTTVRPRLRSRAVRRGAAVVVVTLGSLALVARPGGPDENSPGPVADGSATASSDLSGRGWILDPAGDPPALLEGLRLIDVATIDYADATRPLTLDTVPRKGVAMYAALWCDMPPRSTDLVVPTLTLTLSGHTVALPCAGKHDDPALQRLIPLPPPEERGRVSVGLGWEGDLPGRGSALVATYTEFGQNEPPRTPSVVPDAPPHVPEGSTVMDSDRVSARIGGGELFVQRVTVVSETRLSIWSAGTGTFTIFVDGIIASDDGDTRPPTAGGPAPPAVWQNQDPQLRNGSWTVHAPGQTMQFPLPEVLRPAPGEVREVTMQVHVGAGSGGRWQVQASPASPVLVDIPLPQTPLLARTHLEDR